MSAEGIELVLVDFDDTLVDTAPRFQNARRGLFSYLQTLGVSAEVARRIHHEQIEPRMMAVHGLGPGRLEHSFRATYESVCCEVGVGPDQAAAERCAELGRQVAGTPPLLPGALEGLKRLRARYRTVLYTQARDQEYQLSCVRESGVLGILGPDFVRICERKTAAALSALLDAYGVGRRERAWMVGNSVRSDVNPALEVGVRAILVEVADPWEFDLVAPISDDFIRQPSFAAAADYLLGLTTQHAG